ncbi:cysteine desulfurase family protein [Aquisediminimonas sediminicola]|uniref:cysteine desulfurase family protein n=1 Tax=Alteraquisediminimonas sediminicola TaxID=2676787 RepID=UPI001C8CF51A|nr:aminotransferase class V-fold PLP-dependent enzyme [Aquisediminimonas sediminicola]
MKDDRLYLDHAATTPVLAAVRAAVAEAMAHWANPSSPHADGRASRAMLEDARARIARALNFDGMIILTSGATESLHMAFNRAPVDARFVSAVEHDALQRMGEGSYVLPVREDGLVAEDALAGRLGALAAKRPLLAIQSVNNETGVIQPLDALYPIIQAAGGLLLADCAQSAGKLALPEADFVVVSGHKLGGPPGVGALLLRDPATLSAVGGQEQGYRPGTENVPGAVGLAVALEQGRNWVQRAADLRAHLDSSIESMGGEIVAKRSPRLATIASYRMPGVPANAQLIQFDMAGISVSAGSACSSGSLKTSHVLAAMGWDEVAAREVVRVSFGPETSRADVYRFTEAWQRIAQDGRQRQKQMTGA